MHDLMLTTDSRHARGKRYAARANRNNRPIRPHANAPSICLRPRLSILIGSPAPHAHISHARPNSAERQRSMDALESMNLDPSRAPAVQDHPRQRARAPTRGIAVVLPRPRHRRRWPRCRCRCRCRLPSPATLSHAPPRGFASSSVPLPQSLHIVQVGAAAIRIVRAKLEGRSLRTHGDLRESAVSGAASGRQIKGMRSPTRNCRGLAEPPHHLGGRQSTLMRSGMSPRPSALGVRRSAVGRENTKQRISPRRRIRWKLRGI